MPEVSGNPLVDTMQKVLADHPLLSAQGRGRAREISESLLAPFAAMLSPGGSFPARWPQQWLAYQHEMTRVWLSAAVGRPPADAATRDRRFKSPLWDEGVFALLRESYLLTARTMAEMADSAGLPPHEQRKLSFYVRLAADALAPSNYLLTNPEVLDRARKTNGLSLVDGLRNLLDDLQKGDIRTSDDQSFAVGVNLATTPGAVVFRNELVEVIQYRPKTAVVRAKPILITPPCVNKFYIWDINEKKSMIRYLVEQGLAVFTISWRNPSAELQDYGWDEYLRDGIFAAIEVVSEVAKADRVDLLSWCNGGTMLVAALSVIPDELKRKVGTATFLSSLIDFADPGELEVFVDRPQIEAYNQRMRTARLAPGRDIARAMALLHANESIWNFVINNYLMGKSPPPFDVLYWNADTSNLPSRWFSYYIEEMYLKNLLKEPGGLTLLGRPVDTRAIGVPAYFVAASEDHIVPWKTSYAATRLIGGEAEFVVADGGHVSGTVINHPAGSRRTFHVAGDRSRDAEGWLASAQRREGSWWPHWLSWLDAHATAAPTPAPKTLGSRRHPPMDPAPGRYVTEPVKQDS